MIPEIAQSSEGYWRPRRCEMARALLIQKCSAAHVLLPTSPKTQARGRTLRESDALRTW